MVTSPTAPARDDDPAHPNFDGIVFYATTNHDGIVVTPATGQSTPPVSFLPIGIAVGAASDVSALIDRIREADPQSYLAAYLDDMLADFMDAIATCKPGDAT